ncbi:hypothetical protein [Loigolactobacillus backii]|uniref:hypothetical protein n=1 Tax=Loigolactobacillus backii TaxID=375175 RepID=UPI000C1CB548|nr:hypothetical protein [Loigolactobacillus backii]MDA5388101.1 hypothetical protein [Loigolactobacillus backii]MDA5390593.1 hypothetical protein [Loigolactobacillus backii]PIO82113.1 hypothetical protein BSQ39_00330 [Loigolactobacillus backii]
MTDEGIKFTTLSDQAKQTAIQDFMAAYIDQFRWNNLEVFEASQSEGDIPAINKILMSGARFDKKDLMAYLTQRVGEHFSRLMTKLDQSYLANGTPIEPWETWFEDHRLQLEDGQ